MDREELKGLVKQVIMDLLADDEETNENVGGVGNTTGNVAGYDAPMGAKVRRKLSDLFVDDDEDD